MIKGIAVVVVAGLTVAAVKAMIDDGIVIRLLGGVACSDSQESTCGTHAELVDALSLVKQEAGVAQGQLGAKIGELETKVEELETKVGKLEAEPTFPADDWDNFTNHTWKRDDGEPRPGPEPMIPTDEGFCFLTRIEGSFEGDKE